MTHKIIVAKAGFNAKTETNPKNLKFSSDYGTLKYFQKINQILTIDASVLDVSARGIYTHNLGYYPYCEVFVRVYIGSPIGNYEYCPFEGSGASVAYGASYLIKENTIELFGAINGVSSSVWTFDFLIFLYENNLSL